MRRPSWESSTGALAALLNGSANTQLAMVDLYTISSPLTGGLVLRYSGADRPVTVNGNTFGLGPIIRRGRTRMSVGIEVDTLDVTMNADSSVLVSGVPLLQFIARGGFDGFRMLVERAYASAPGAAVTGTLPLFSGRISAVTGLTRMEVQLSVISDAELLDVLIPRNVYQAPCLNTLFDSACGLARAGFTASGTCNDTAATRSRFTYTGLAQATGYFDLGVATFTSGVNNGISRTVRAYGAGVITTIAPFPSPPANGDTFSIVAGCDKRQATCSSKFSNLARFRGAPYIPTPESIL